MHISLHRSDLLSALALTQGIVERRVTVPILSHVLMTAAEDQLTLTATDVDMTVQTTIPAATKQPGALTLPAHMLYDIVRKLPDHATLTIEQEDGQSVARLRAGASDFTLPTLPAGDFMHFTPPVLPHTFQIESSVLRDLLMKTRFAMSSEESRYTLNGIYLHAGADGTLRAVATDVHRLAFAAHPLAGLPPFPPAILPKKMVAELCKWLDHVDAAMTLGFSDAQMSVSLENASLRTTLSSRLIDGVFPEYERVIPDETAATATIPIQEMTQALGRVATLAQDEQRGVLLTLAPQELTLEAPKSELGSAVETLSIPYVGPSMRLGFNPRYLLDVLQHVSGTYLNLSFSDAINPVIAKGDPSEDTKTSTLYVLMPMRL